MLLRPPLIWLQQILIRQCPHAWGDLGSDIAGCEADGFGRLDAEPADEDGQPPEQYLLRRFQQIVAPRYRVPQGTPTLRQVPGTTRQ